MSIVIGLAGDVMIGRLLDEVLNTKPPGYIWGDLFSMMRSTDLNMVNLETTLTHSTKLVPKVFNFKATPTKVQSLVDGAIHVVNLANNHILDFAEEGLLETVKTLDGVKIQHVGAGKNLSEATEPVIVTKKGIRIGILGCTDNEKGWAAQKDRCGTFYLEVGDLKTIRHLIVQLRPQVDILIVSIHWGPNMRERPSHEFQKFAHGLIDAGADVIHGHSAHIFQGIEVYREKLIFYDTGDFVDDYAVDPLLRNDRTFFFLLEVDKKGLHSLRLIPALISNFQVNRAKGREAEEILRHMQDLSAELKTNLKLLDKELQFQF